jgi:hypothetical protein
MILKLGRLASDAGVDLRAAEAVDVRADPTAVAGTHR